MQAELLSLKHERSSGNIFETTASIPFADSAIPLVDNGIVYGGTYALRAKVGKVI